MGPGELIRTMPGLGVEVAGLQSIPQILGWVGMSALLIAYAWRKTLHPPSYALLNLVGAGLLSIVLFTQAAWPAFALECIWGMIAIRDLWHAGRDRVARSRAT